MFTTIKDSAYNILATLIVVALPTACQSKHDYVDLGLPSGTLWATYNVGASTPTEVGDFFAWGETQPKVYFSWEGYKWGDESKLEKYCTNSKYGEVDSITVLTEDDDAATVNWGSDWRMPSKAEFEELVKCCNWEQTNNYQGSGVGGMIGTSRYNQKKIFLPMAKMLEKWEWHQNKAKYSYCTIIPENDLEEQSKITPGGYFSKDLDKSSSLYAEGIDFGYDCDRFWIYNGGQKRIKGSNIRAVRTNKIESKQKDIPEIFKTNNGLESDSVAEFRVRGDYKKQSLTISGFFNHTTDWTYSTIDTLVANNMLYVMVKGVDTKRNKTKEPHKSAFFQKEYKIPANIEEVVFGPTNATIWERGRYIYPEEKCKPVAEMVKIIESTELTPHYQPTCYDIKEEDKVTPVRCSDTSEFASLMPKGYIFNGIFSSCDVNKDGKTDYLLAIEGPYSDKEIEYWEKEKSTKGKEKTGNEDEEENYDSEEAPEHAKEGIMLVINEGDTSYVSDIWNSGCFYDVDGGNYTAPELSVFANKDTLEIHYGHGRYGYRKYTFMYRNGNFQLTEDIDHSGGAIPILYRHMDLDKGIEERESLKTDYPYKEEDEEYEVSKYAIKRSYKYTLTNMARFNDQ